MALYVYGGVDTRYKIALNVIKAIQKVGTRAPFVQNVVKKIKILQDEGFYETVDTRDDLPVLAPSDKFTAHMLVNQLERRKKKIKEDSGKLIEKIDCMISEIRAYYGF